MTDFIQLYGYEFLIIATAHLLAVASPGPDFAIVSKHALTYGRRCALYTSIGVGCAILLHVTYTVIGIGLLLSQTPWLFNLFKYAAAAYLAYIGFGAIRSKPPTAAVSDGSKSTMQYAEISNKRAFWTGFLTNGLNPKATLFFLSLFTVIVSATTPMLIKVFYGLYMAVATALWFCFLSMILTLAGVRQRLLSKGYIIDRVMGVILIGLALKLVFSSM